MLGVVAADNLELIQLDVKTAFLHGDLQEEIYMEQPKGFVAAGQEHLVCRLRKRLYGLKQAPLQWYKKFDDFIRSVGYSKSDEDHCLFTKTTQDGSPVFLIIYVDDMFLSGRHTGELTELVVMNRTDMSLCPSTAEETGNGMPKDTWSFHLRHYRLWISSLNRFFLK